MRKLLIGLMLGVCVCVATAARYDDGYEVIKSFPSDGTMISLGAVKGMSAVAKFGAAPDFDSGDGEVDVWDGAEDGTSWENMVYDFSTTADIDSLSSSDASDNQDIEIQGLDGNTNLVTQTVTLSGQTRVDLSTDLYRVFRMKNVGTSNLTGHVFCYVTNSITGGVPDDASKIRGIIHPENNQTEMAIYTVPNGKTAVLKSVDASILGANKSASYIIRLYARSPGGVFRLQKRFVLEDGVNPFTQYIFSVSGSYSAGTDLKLTADIVGGAVTAAGIVGGFDIVLKDN
jgi:hypothetical protein